MGLRDQRPIKVVAGLIYRDGHLLACQRRVDGAFPLKWEFPGGKVEGAEEDLAALERELREELAIGVRRAAPFRQYDHVYENGLRVSLCFYKVIEHDGEPENLVFERILWVSLADLETLDFLDGDRPLIVELVSSGGPALLDFARDFQRPKKT
jgi:8-oxo-dGTP diphosphatase